MNYYHAINDGGAHVIAVNDPCTRRSCPADHFVVVAQSQWNDVAFLLDRVAVLASRIDYVSMPEGED